MQKKVLGIIGSPRKGGNTDELVDLVLKGAADKGAAEEKVYLADQKIENCKECLHCHNGSEKCVLRDDMEELAQKMEAADVWVLGTPIFWWGPTGLFKTFLDRWFGYHFSFKSKKIILVYPSGDSSDSVARLFVGMMDEALNYEGTQAFAHLHAGGVDGPGDLRKHPEFTKQAYLAGAESVK